ncbi:V-set and immunoglobulin domain-containing protein 10-like 2 [Nothobranchius furzeri]|uniref:V-set and immunoglobulin domain-containing protein 10-like 2 n=1 Tax=Nothobranchius furzeri TaxID=105023 RepID=UPI0024043934|nr:V-set and immunoglobulin domain-containing protein 10-like 2 [Nothobranchius furzeri]
MLSCIWDGGAPKALVWWDAPGGQGKAGEETSNVLVVRYNSFYFGKPYVCYAKHPLMVQTKTCSLTLATVSKPSLLISEAAPVEKSTTWMRCNVENGTKPILYVWQYKNNSGSITTFAQGNSSMVTMSNVNRSVTGLYRCVSSNFINSESSDWFLLDVICEY